MHVIEDDLQTLDCRSAWRHMSDVSARGQVRNFVQRLDMSDYLVETPLFPAEALRAYSAINMEQAISDEQARYITDQRGGPQGDYHEGMQRKIANVIDCLTKYPNSKRAVLTVCNEPIPDHSDDAAAKCLRELHLYLDDAGKLSATVFFRAQAASLFPKNIHLVGSIMTQVAAHVPSKPALGTVFYLATLLVSDRR